MATLLNVQKKTEGFLDHGDDMEKNALCEFLDIRYPIIQAPMNWISGPALVAAVSNAGGLGTLGPNAGAKTITADVKLTGERLRSQIRAVKTLTEKPFAVNIPIGTKEQHKYADRFLEVVLEEGIAVAIVSAGSPARYTKKLKELGIKVLHVVSTAAHARKAEEAGVDVLICGGFEAGGHKGFDDLTIFTLIPMVAGVAKIPIVAGGGICDARGLLAALSLGADGVYMGTRFMATFESDSHSRVKEAVLRAEDACTVCVPRGQTMVRELKNNFTDKYLRMVKTSGPEELDDFVQEHSAYHALVLGDCEYSGLPCGQGAGIIGELVSASAVIEEMAKGVSSALTRLQGKLSNFF
jgi:enoyl-[acyl-carrier protein] reductase II